MDPEVINNMKNLLYELKDKPKHEKMLLFASLLTELLEKHDIKPIIVGGLSVEIYTRGDYTTRDIDFVFPGRHIADNILLHLDFVKEGRYWYHPILEIAVEIPDDFLDGDKEKIIKFNLENQRHIYVIGIEDLILDRLRACVFRKSSSDCEWALRLMLTHKDILDFDYLQKKSVEDKTAEKLNHLLEKYF